MSFPRSDNVVSRCDHFIKAENIPGLTGTCLKVVADIWNMHASYRYALEQFLVYDVYDMWYDETIICVSFFLRNPHLQTESTRRKLAELKNRAIAEGEATLIDFFR
jgi:hypothetical protein